MNVLEKLRRFTIGLLACDENLVTVGRANFERTEFTTAYIVVDALGNADRIGSTESFDGNTEELTAGDQYRTPCTISFFGDGANETARQFIALTRSQAAKELQDTLLLAVYRPSGLTDVKALTGSQYSEEVEVSVTVIDSTAATVVTKRIDTAQISILTEQGEVLP